MSATAASNTPGATSCGSAVYGSSANRDPFKAVAKARCRFPDPDSTSFSTESQRSAVRACP